jgi:hypothetical protein
MFKEEFRNHLLKFNTLPFLFIGSGFSRRYIGLETWEDLLSKMVTRLGLNMPYNYFISNANNDLPKAASLIGTEFNKLWWVSTDFEESRNEYMNLAKSPYSPIKYEIAKYLGAKEKDISIEYKDEIALLKKVKIDGIITTNWDNLLEYFFPDFEKFIGQDQLIFSELYSIGEIYKIHGCISNAESLILTDEDYHQFNQRYPYLAAKLLTVFVEHPIIFIGYSIEDENIQEILKSVIKCLTKDKIDLLKDRLIFCNWDPSVTETTFSESVLFISDTTLPIKLITISDYSELYAILADTKKRLPTKVLRQMKGMVYDFVKNTDSKSKVYVSDDLETLEDIHNVEFVYGLGLKERFAEVGIVGTTTRDLMRDVVLDNDWDINRISRICRLLLPNLQGKYVPYFKYLSKAGFLDSAGNIPTNNEIQEFDPSFVSTVNNIKLTSFEPTGSYYNKKNEINEKYTSFLELKNGCNYNHTLIFTTLLDHNKIELDELKLFLKSNIDKLVDAQYGTYYRKLICLYDYLKYKPQAVASL